MCDGGRNNAGRYAKNKGGLKPGLKKIGGATAGNHGRVARGGTAAAHRNSSGRNMGKDVEKCAGGLSGGQGCEKGLKTVCS